MGIYFLPPQIFIFIFPESPCIISLFSSFLLSISHVGLSIIMSSVFTHSLLLAAFTSENYAPVAQCWPPSPVTRSGTYKNLQEMSHFFLYPPPHTISSFPHILTFSASFFPFYQTTKLSAPHLQLYFIYLLHLFIIYFSTMKLLVSILSSKQSYELG